MQAIRGKVFRKREFGQSTIPETTSTSLTPGQQKQEETLQFIGPAQKEFKSFLKFARYSLDNYWHSWRKYESPRNYIIPPIFEFKHPDKSDQDIQSKKPGSLFHRETVDRFSDEGEHQIFEMICEMTQIDSLAPFLAVRNLNIGGESRIRAYLSQIFSNVAADFSRSSEIKDIKALIDCITEFDFVLIGPKIGIVVIEVKSSSFTKAKDFQAKNTHLPDQILIGIKQLQSFDTFLSLLALTTDIDKPNGSQIRKIMFLANLEKSRFDNWFENLGSHVKQNVGNILGSAGVNYWFKKIGKIDCLDQSIPKNTYEIYGSIIAGIASMSISKNAVNMDELKLSESRSVEKVSQRVTSQDPLGILESRTGAKRQNLEFSGEIVEHFSKSIILTPDQQRILNGPDRQFIIGAAGTGKTVILQEKALRLIRQGESVLVLVSKSYVGKFQKLLAGSSDSSVQKRFKVEEWGAHEFCLTRFGITFSMTCKDLRELQEIDKEGFRKQFGWMLNYDHILIDDACDSCDDTDKIIGTLAFARIRVPPVKTFWMAFDYQYQYRHPYYPDKEGYFVRNLIGSITRSEDPAAYYWRWLYYTDHASIQNCLAKFGDIDKTGVYYSASILSRVMRYPENIFKIIFKTKVIADTYACFIPTPGHKIQGFHRSRKRTFKNMQKAMIHISKTILHEMENLQREKVDMKDVAVVTNGVDSREHGDDYSGMELKKYLSEYFQQFKIVSSLEGLSELQIIDWTEVSSLEWPIVIYAACLPSGKTWFRPKSQLRRDLEEWRLHGRYRARTRTTGKLIEVVASFQLKDV